MRKKAGFTLIEMLIVVAIIAVLVAIAIPVLNNQIEKSRESTDLANVRGAYAKIMVAVLTGDAQDVDYRNGQYSLEVPLKQKKAGWTQDESKLEIGGIKSSDTAHWLNKPAGAGGICKVFCEETDNNVIIDWNAGGASGNSFSYVFEDPMKIISDALSTIIVPHSMINSHEKQPDGGTERLMNALNGSIDFEKMGAATWTIYPTSRTGKENDIIYWSSLNVDDVVKDQSITFDEKGLSNVYIPMMGFQAGTNTYDVYYSRVVRYNDGNTGKTYHSLANVSVNSATFQFSNFDEAKGAYDKLMGVYNEKGTISYSDIVNNGLTT